jgi:hypothetical protein
MIERILPKVWISDQPQPLKIVAGIIDKIQEFFSFNDQDAGYFFHEGKISNSAFSGKEDMKQKIFLKYLIY